MSPLSRDSLWPFPVSPLVVHDIKFKTVLYSKFGRKSRLRSEDAGADLVAIVTTTVFLGSAVHIRRSALFGSRSLQEGAAATCRFQRISQITESFDWCVCIIRSRLLLDFFIWFGCSVNRWLLCVCCADFLFVSIVFYTPAEYVEEAGW